MTAKWNSDDIEQELDAHGDFRLKKMLVFQMSTQRRDVVILVAVRAREIRSDLLFHLKIIEHEKEIGMDVSRRILMVLDVAENSISSST